MSIQAILMPMFAQVALTFVLLFWMGGAPAARASAPAQVEPQRSAARAQLAAAGAPDRQRLP